jgi:hypothetical protein
VGELLQINTANFVAIKGVRLSVSKRQEDWQSQTAGEPAMTTAKKPGAAFFETGRTYQRGRWQFQCLAVDTAPWDGQIRAAGFLLRSDGTGIVHGMAADDWAHGEWTAVAPA